MVVPFAPGGGSDVVARILVPRLSELLGQQVVVENVGGSGGMTGSNRVARAPPDGYQIGFGVSGTHAQNQSLYKMLTAALPADASVTGFWLSNTEHEPEPCTMGNGMSIGCLRRRAYLHAVRRCEQHDAARRLLSASGGFPMGTPLIASLGVLTRSAGSASVLTAFRPLSARSR